MSSLDADTVRSSLGEGARSCLAALEVFAEIDSTNSHLMRQPGPEPGRMRVAIADHQTAGRGRRGRTWQSPPGSGLCLSMAYTFSRVPRNLPALTLATGLGVIGALARFDITDVQLKWPNDLVRNGGKLGGILTEAQTGSDHSITIVTGVGINVRLDAALDLASESDGALLPVDLRDQRVPELSRLSAAVIDALQDTFLVYEQQGFAAFTNRWHAVDWLFGRAFTVDAPRRTITGVGAGVSADGALLIDTDGSGVQRVASGTVTMAGREAPDR